jgi:cyclohexadienyl dehydratase
MARHRTLRTAVPILLALCVAGYASGIRAEPPSGPVLRVGTSGDYAPFSLEGRGFDVDVAERFAEETGMRIEWVPFRWPELQDAVAANRFDVAMSGVTWRPERALVGFMTQAVAAGGPCLVGSAEPARIAVNRGGILERWVRESFPGAEVVAVDDNLSLPERLRSGEVDAFATDSFEVAHLAPEGAPRRCEPPRDRKVYWVAPARAGELGPVLDAWLDLNEAALDELRRTWLGGAAPRDPVDHLVDLLARRLAFMPFVGAWKRERGLDIEDAAREASVLGEVESSARTLGLEVESTLELFRVQIELAKSIQRRTPVEVAPLELARVRPVLSRLGRRILLTLAYVAPIAPSDLHGARMGPLEPILEQEELTRLAAALTRVRRNAPAP